MSNRDVLGSQQILKHTPREKDFEFAVGDNDTISQVTDHIEKHIGPIENVFHEIISDLVHVDVYCIKPTLERNFYTLVTSGMSDKAMTVPEGLEEFRFAELMICLPPDWQLSQDGFKDEANYWPVRWLKKLARLPHEYDTWLGYGHTIPNGDPEESFAYNTKLSCMMISLPQMVSDPIHFFELKINDIGKIHFYQVIPLYKEETAFKLKKGADALLDKFDEHGITGLVDIGRKNVCKRTLWPF